ncbi:MAG: carbon-nitrogen hydrolase family protein [Sedimentisphaerales bacterium]|nr:carbon-nitrogen hydrolase family protein [Sedimentisphaerales bacterium]
MAGTIHIATCQFAVSSSIQQNSRSICRYIRKASSSGADIVHFSECALSGYVGTDFPNFANYDWELLKTETLKIMSLAAEQKIWVVLGSTHQLTKPNKPHNSLYLINSKGEIVDRYDKRFCTPGDLKRMTPGNHFVNFEINGVKCSLLICFDLRFPELYRGLYKEGVNCIFQSFYNAKQSGPSIHSHIMHQTMQSNAACNNFWISMSNSSGYYAPYPSCFIQPDGKIIGKLKNNKSGMMINTVDLKKQFYDPMKNFREMAIHGQLNNSNSKTSDPRSKNRTTL